MAVSVLSLGPLSRHYDEDPGHGGTVISSRKAADLGSTGFTWRPRTTTATRRAPASLSAAAVDWALPPETQVSSTTRTSPPATASPARTQPGLTPLVWISAGTMDSRTKGKATHARTISASGWVPERPC